MKEGWYNLDTSEKLYKTKREAREEGWTTAEQVYVSKNSTNLVDFGFRMLTLGIFIGFIAGLITKSLL